MLTVYDMPGLSESISSRERHLSVYAKVLKDVDVALWVLDAQARPMEAVQRYLLHEIREMNPKLVNRMVFALNKVDLVYPGERDWHPLANLPSEMQEKNISARINDVKRKISEAAPSWEGKVIGYSAARRYNLPQLFSVMLEAVPQKRQWVLASRKALADFLEFVDPKLLPEDRRPQQKQLSRDDRMIADLAQEISDEEFAQAIKSKESLATYLQDKINQTKK